MSHNIQIRINKFYISGLFLFITLSACDHRVRAKFEIRNNSNSMVDSLSIDPNQNISDKFISLNPGEAKTYWTDMSNIPKVDGDYLRTYKLNRSKEVKNSAITQMDILQKNRLQ